MSILSSRINESPSVIGLKQIVLPQVESILYQDLSTIVTAYCAESKVTHSAGTDI